MQLCYVTHLILTSTSIRSAIKLLSRMHITGLGRRRETTLLIKVPEGLGERSPPKAEAKC